MRSSTSGQFVRVSVMRSVTGIATASSRQSSGGSVVSEDARGGHNTGADALPVADPELGSGAPAQTDHVMGSQRVVAGRTTGRRVNRRVNEGGRDSVHGESVGPASGLSSDRLGPPIRCQRKNPSVVPPYARSALTRTGRSFPVQRHAGGRQGGPDDVLQ